MSRGGQSGPRSQGHRLTFHVDPRQDVLKRGRVQQVTHFLQGLERGDRRTRWTYRHLALETKHGEA